jgi:phospholipid/cholesterol/gamma-HCH transport system substrate-binding protein
MEKYARETTVGIFMVVGLVCVAYMTIKLGHVSFLGENTYPLYAPFTTVSGLRVDAPVDMYGIQIGRVERITINQKDQMAVVELRIQKGIQVYEGLIGDEYISLSPGGAGAQLKPGGTITQTQPAVDLYDLISKYIFGTLKKD